MTKLPVLGPSLETGRAELRLHDKKPRMSDAEAKAEADRCLYCTDAPCIKACPTEIDIPTFIKKIASQNVRGSARTIFEQNIFGYSCARVCPVEVLCEGSCVYTAWQKKPISIGRLQRYATELATDDLTKPLAAPKRGGTKRVACIGAGPASIAFAAYLALDGHQATIFEKRPLPGGLNTTGVAPYKLHAHDALREVEWVRSLGVTIESNAEIADATKGADLVAKYDAVFIGVGLGDDSKLGIPGEDGPGVVGATAWIEEMKLKAGAATHLGRVVVIGGGNTAVDVARECAQLGAAQVVLAYRRSAEAMSGYAHELDGAKRDGVRIVTGVTPMSFVRAGGGALEAVRFKRADGTNVELECDLAALAIGQSKLRAISNAFPGVTVDARGCVVAEAKTGKTGNPKVFAGGDCVNGGKEVVNAVAEGRDAARHLLATWSA